MRIRNVKIKEDKWKKLYVKLKPYKRNMYRKYLIITSKQKILNYNIKVKVGEYVKLKPPKMNL